ncbi:MAG TPA: cysteine--tRNA ligase [Chloroflexota bacterium]|nr:cysteine--tRNA ligase [Chloroflexota bacterium]
MKIYNTLTAREEEFVPYGEPVKVYVCGVTPYSDAHVGHAMSAIVFDTIRRYLEYRGYRVHFVQNFTDVDDKIIDRSNRLGVPAMDLAERYIGEFYVDLARLHIKPATDYVRATSEIGSIIRIIGGLIDKGFAYPADGDVYFRVMRDPDYGKLSHRSLDDLEAGARVEVDPRKETPMDFALWKAAKPGEPSWPSPWGAGRPGWHIECSAIVLDHLGPQIDIHGGGADLIFPHHENEIAQSESWTGLVPFAKYWVHNGLLQLGGEKMSKSLGNLVTIKEALEQFSADALRAFVLTAHYRRPLSYSDEGVSAAERGVARLRAALTPRPAGEAEGEPPDLAEARRQATERFVEAMDDDFNTTSALAQLFELAKEINRSREAGVVAAGVVDAQKTLLDLAGVLGLTLEEPKENLAAKPFVDLLLSIRQELRSAKQYALADQIRQELEALGVAVEDRPGGTTWRTAR